MTSMTAAMEQNWGKTANCYAYACNRKTPATPGQLRTAVPGAAKGRRPRNNGNVQELIAGILADGEGRVRQIAGTPSNVPVPPAGSYLIAMLTSGFGFHFIRRSDLGAWTWKDGNQGSVKINIKHRPSNTWMIVRDADLKNLLVKKKSEYEWSYNSMTFQGFFCIPNGGIDVSA